MGAPVGLVWGAHGGTPLQSDLKRRGGLAHIMERRTAWKCNAQLLVVVLCTFVVKLYYSTASVNHLRWILAPTTVIVELVTGSQFEFESHAGYITSDRTFVIAASCAGVNFLITSFLMLSLRKLWQNRSRQSCLEIHPRCSTVCLSCNARCEYRAHFHCAAAARRCLLRLAG